MKWDHCASVTSAVGFTQNSQELLSWQEISSATDTLFCKWSYCIKPNSFLKKFSFRGIKYLNLVVEIQIERNFKFQVLFKKLIHQKSTQIIETDCWVSSNNPLYLIYMANVSERMLHFNNLGLFCPYFCDLPSQRKLREVRCGNLAASSLDLNCFPSPLPSCALYPLVSVLILLFPGFVLQILIPTPVPFTCSIYFHLLHITILLIHICWRN